MTITASSPIHPAPRRRGGRDAGRATGRDAGHPDPAGDAGPPPLRLTRRGRIVVVLALVLLSLGVLSAGRQAVSAVRDDRPATVQVTVRPGDTLWSIAADITPKGRDVRITVAQIRALNGLHGGTVRAGDTLRLPRR